MAEGLTDQQAINRAQQIIYREAQRIPGYKRYRGTELQILCPFHRERTPSCGINLDPNHGKVPLGWFYCFGCGAKGHWNRLADKFKLEKIKESDLKRTQTGNRDLISVRNKLLSSDSYDVERLAASFGIGLMLDFPEYQDWRKIKGKILSKVGAKLIFDNYHDDNAVLLPVYMNGEVVGGVKAVMEKEEGDKKVLGYVTSQGEWAKSQGLFPYDYTKSLIEKKGLKSVVLVEGSRDALRLLQYGIPALAILGTQNWSKAKLSMLIAMGVDHVIVMMDGDGAGVKATNQIMKDCKHHLSRTRIKLKEIADKLERKVDPGNCSKAILRDVKGRLKYV